MIIREAENIVNEVRALKTQLESEAVMTSVIKVHDYITSLLADPNTRPVHLKDVAELEQKVAYLKWFMREYLGPQ